MVPGLGRGKGFPQRSTNSTWTTKNANGVEFPSLGVPPADTTAPKNEPRARPVDWAGRVRGSLDWLPKAKAAEKKAGVDINQELLAELEKMGFGRALSQQALVETGNNLQEAVGWIIDNMDSFNASMGPVGVANVTATIATIVSASGAMESKKLAETVFNTAPSPTANLSPTSNSNPVQNIPTIKNIATHMKNLGMDVAAAPKKKITPVTSPTAISASNASKIQLLKRETKAPTEALETTSVASAILNLGETPSKIQWIKSFPTIPPKSPVEAPSAVVNIEETSMYATLANDCLAVEERDCELAQEREREREREEATKFDEESNYSMPHHVTDTVKNFINQSSESFQIAPEHQQLGDFDGGEGREDTREMGVIEHAFCERDTVSCELEVEEEGGYQILGGPCNYGWGVEQHQKMPSSLPDVSSLSLFSPEESHDLLELSPEDVVEVVAYNASTWCYGYVVDQPHRHGWFPYALLHGIPDLPVELTGEDVNKCAPKGLPAQLDYADFLKDENAQSLIQALRAKKIP